jgi:hypothetical protein
MYVLVHKIIVHSWNIIASIMQVKTPPNGPGSPNL